MPTATETTSSNATRERLLATACRAFAARGFPGVSVRDICAESQANVAAVSYHFGGKEGLYLEALRRSFAELHTPAVVLGEGDDAHAALRKWIRASVMRSLSPARPHWAAQLLWRELLDPTEAMSTLTREVMAPEMQNVTNLLQALTPSLTDEECRLWCFTIMGQILLHDFARTPTLELMGKRKYGEDDIETIAAHLTNVVIRGLGLNKRRERR